MILALVQVAWLARVQVWGAILDPLVPLIVGMGILKGAESGAVVGVAAGLLQDLLSGGGPLGVNGLSKLVVGFASGMFERSIYIENPLLPALAGRRGPDDRAGCAEQRDRPAAVPHHSGHRDPLSARTLGDESTAMEYQQPAKRLFVFNLLIGMLMGILIVRLWQLQVLQGGYYLRQSEENRIRDYTLSAPRGIISDRKGRPLVSNRPSFTVAVLPLELQDPPRVVTRLASILGITSEEITRRIEANRPRLFEPVRIKRDVGAGIVAVIEENRLDLPGVVILVEPVRHYLHDKIAAHVLGYLGEIDVEDLAARRSEGYRPGDLIGKAGVERAFEAVLRGVDGRMRVEVDALGRPLRILSRVPAVPGRALALTLDLDVQRAAYDALQASGLAVGAAIAMDPRSGDILAMANLPSYDPNQFAMGIGSTAWQAITTDPRKPLLNRALGATYEPGSVFKLVTAMAALDQGIVSRRTMFDAPGYFQLGQWVFWDLKAWGRIDFITGIANSVNVVFYTLGYRLGGEELANHALLMGLE